MHIEETKKRQRALSSDTNPLAELMSTAYTITAADEIRKAVTDVPIDSTVDYGRNVSWNGHDVPLGKIANTLRALRTKYGSWDKAMTSPEALALYISGSTL